MRHTLFAWLTLFTLASGLHAQPSTGVEASVTSSDTVERCVAEHENARLLRIQEKWFDARASMQRCADAVCPLALRSDCRAWLTEVADTLPTLILVVEHDEPTRSPIDVTLDGEPITLAEPASPIEVLPGKHVLRFTLSGYPAIERSLELAKGEKNRVIRVRFASRAGADARVNALAAPLPAAPHFERRRPVRANTYALSAGALVAFSVSAVLLGSALSSLSSARDTCAPACASGTRRSIESRLLFADISAGGGLVLGGLALYTFVTRPTVYSDVRASSESAPESTLGATLSFQGRF